MEGLNHEPRHRRVETVVSGGLILVSDLLLEVRDGPGGICDSPAERISTDIWLADGGSLVRQRFKSRLVREPGGDFRPDGGVKRFYADRHAVAPAGVPSFGCETASAAYTGVWLPAVLPW